MATNARGRQREYRFYITWDSERERYPFLSTLTFAAADAIVWVGRNNSSAEPPDVLAVSFRETWRRR